MKVLFFSGFSYLLYLEGMHYRLELSYESMAVGDLSPEERDLLKKAQEAAEYAYAPYSGFPVGAAARLSDGRLLSGNNQENSAYPSGLCAERTLLFYLGSQRLIPLVQMIAVYAPLSEDPVMPCGACRQVMYEYERLGSIRWTLIFAGASGRVYRFMGMETLLPFAFVWRR
ncbi:MAG: cytidine deaminase [Bacteroidia bacterium]|nr:cytidine deaminase [Bacteroidia bacterium]